MPGTVAITSLILSAVLLQHLQIVAEQLDRVLALHAGRRLLDVVLDVLGEVEVDAGECRLQLVGHVVGQLLLVDAGRPGVEWLQRHEELGVEEAGRVGAVIRPAVLRDDGDHLGIALA